MRYFNRHKIISIVLIVFSIFVYLNYTRVIEPNPKVDKTSEAYTNDIYMSDERIYNNYLNEIEKTAYREIMDMFKKRIRRKYINIDKYKKMTTSDISSALIKAKQAIELDHPELLQFSTAYTKYSDTEVELIIDFAINNPIQESLNTLKIRRIIDKIKKETKDMPDLEKIKYVYEWIGENSTYDTLFTYTSKNQSIYNVFIKKNAVCAGFAKASQVIFQNIGIESMTITGESTGPHMWNIIKYKGKYYYYDSTYAASINDKDDKYYYDGLIQESMNSYIANYSEWYPQIEKTSVLFTKKNNQ